MINKNKSRNTVCVLAELSQDEEERLLAESREKAYRDWQASIDGAFSDGETKEKIKGIVMLVSKYNIPLDSAMSDFDLNESYKEQILKELKKCNK